MNDQTNGDFRGDGAEVVYQIFPDRFRSGDTSLTPKPGAWEWHGKPIEVARVGDDDDDFDEKLTTRPSDQYTFFGGDFAGIRLSIPHLVSLGVTTAYLNPIFAARSVHRYDTIDYLRPDSALGSREDFDRLVDDLHANGIRIFLDGVFNHTSRDHAWHIDPVTRRQMYVMKSDEKAMGWMGGESLPKLDTQNETVQQKIFEVLDCWSNVDGWRLDAAHLLPQGFLKRLRAHVSPKPIVVEDWHFARHYFEKGLADGVTNFLFRNALKHFFMEDCSPETLFERLREWIYFYPPECRQCCWNYLDNHDLPRFVTEVHRRDRLMRGLVLMFTLPGVPQLYQGIEYGMEGATAAEARKPMVWDDSAKENDDDNANGVLKLLRALSAFRHRHVGVFAGGRFEPVFADNRTRTLAFRRVRESEDSSSSSPAAVAVVAMNDGYAGSVVETEFGVWKLDAGDWRIAVQSGGGGTDILSSENLTG